MGKSLGYSIRDCSGGISCIVVAQPLKRRNGLVVTGAQCSIYGAGLALAHRLAVVGGNGQELFGGRRQHKLISAIDFLLRISPRINGNARLVVQKRTGVWKGKGM